MLSPPATGTETSRITHPGAKQDLQHLGHAGGCPEIREGPQRRHPRIDTPDPLTGCSRQLCIGHAHASCQQRLSQLVQDTVAAGASLVTGGQTDPNSTFLAPTILKDVQPSHPIMQQENEYLAALLTAATYTIQGDVLELRAADGALVASYLASGN